MRHVSGQSQIEESFKYVYIYIYTYNYIYIHTVYTYKTSAVCESVLVMKGNYARFCMRKGSIEQLCRQVSEGAFGFTTTRRTTYKEEEGKE